MGGGWVGDGWLRGDRGGWVADICAITNQQQVISKKEQLITNN